MDGIHKMSIWVGSPKGLTSQLPATRKTRRNRKKRKGPTCSPRLPDVTVRSIVATAAPPNIFHDPVRGARFCVRVAACSGKLFSCSLPIEVVGSVAPDLTTAGHRHRVSPGTLTQKERRSLWKRNQT